MKRLLLDELLREVERITGERQLVMIGSQAIHAVVADVPAEVVMSRECDLLFDESDPFVAAIDASLGPDSERAIGRRKPKLAGDRATRPGASLMR